MTSRIGTFHGPPCCIAKRTSGCACRSAPTIVEDMPWDVPHGKCDAVPLTVVFESEPYLKISTAYRSVGSYTAISRSNRYWPLGQLSVGAGAEAFFWPRDLIHAQPLIPAIPVPREATAGGFYA